MGKIHEIVFDCDAPGELAAFWMALLDGYAIRTPDDAERALLDALGLSPDNKQTVMLDGPGPSICFQNVEGRRHDNNRVHFDIAVDDRGARADALVAAGAQIERVLPTYTVMRDPEGNQFVIVDSAIEMAA